MADIQKQAMEIANKVREHYHPAIDSNGMDLWRAYVIGIVQGLSQSDNFGDEYSLNRIRAAIESEKYFLQMVEAEKLVPAIKGK